MDSEIPLDPRERWDCPVPGSAQVSVLENLKDPKSPSAPVCEAGQGSWLLAALAAPRR